MPVDAVEELCSCAGRGTHNESILEGEREIERASDRERERERERERDTGLYAQISLKRT